MTAYLRRSGQWARIRRRQLCYGNGCGPPRCGLRGPSMAGKGGGGLRQHSRGWNRPGDAQCSRDLWRRVAAWRGFCTGGAERGGCGLKCPSHQRLARDGGGLGLPLNPNKYRFRAHGWRSSQIFFGAGAGWGSNPCVFLPPTRKPAINLRVGAIWGSRVALMVVLRP
jgi:hypothetical protein